MKKIISLGLILLFLASLVLIGCGGKEDDTSAVEETMQKETAPAEETVGEAVEGTVEATEQAVDKAEETAKEVLDTAQMKKELEESATKHQGE